MNLLQITAIPRDPEEEDFQPPSPSKPGRVLFEIVHIYQPGENRRGDCYEIEVVDWDSDSAVFWANEGIGVDYLLTDVLDLELEDVGFYVVDGITVDFIRGDGWTTDDDEDWCMGDVRRASPEEIAAGELA
jgi:hypothetical protein